MTRTFIFILIFFGFASFAQNIREGVYHNVKKNRGFESDYFEFKEDNKFNYLLNTCTGISIGAGTYEIKNDSIHFSFENLPELKNQIELNFAESESALLNINLKILAYDDGSELPMVICSLIDENKSWQTDFNGNVSASIEKNNLSRILKIYFIGFEPVEITIPKNTSEINGIVRLGNFWIYDSNERMSFKILSKRNRNFKLARYENRDISYEKVKKNEMTKVIELRTGKTFENFVQK